MRASLRDTFLKNLFSSCPICWHKPQASNPWREPTSLKLPMQSHSTEALPLSVPDYCQQFRRAFFITKMTIMHRQEAELLIFLLHRIVWSSWHFERLLFLNSPCTTLTMAWKRLGGRDLTDFCLTFPTLFIFCSPLSSVPSYHSEHWPSSLQCSWQEKAFWYTKAISGIRHKEEETITLWTPTVPQKINMRETEVYIKIFQVCLCRNTEF